MPWFRDEIYDGDVIHVKLGWMRETRYARASSACNKIEQEAAATVEKLLKILANLEAEKKKLAETVKRIKGRPHNSLGEGSKYYLSNKEMKKFAPLTDKPSGDWMLVLNPLILRKYGLTAPSEQSGSGGKIPQKGSPGVVGKKGAYTLPGMEEHALALTEGQGVDFVVGFKERGGSQSGSDKGSSNHGKELSKQIRSQNPKEPGESDRDYGNRISRLVEEARRKSD